MGSDKRSPLLEAASAEGCAQAKASVELDAPTRPESLFKPFQNEGAFHQKHAPCRAKRDPCLD